MPGVSFDRAASYYDATRGYTAGTAERIRDAILHATGRDQSACLLELGVGTGRIALPFIQAGANYIGIDLSRAMLDVLLEKLAAAGEHRRAQVCLADMMHLPFAPATFDVVLGVHVLHLVADWRQALNEARRVLRSAGGTLVLGYDEWGRERNEHAPAEQQPPALQAHDMWGAILADLGYDKRHGQPGVRPNDPQVAAWLQEQGAATRNIELTAYQRPPASARDVVARYQARIYSSDWALPDAVHAEAVARIERWLNEECAAPDEPVVGEGSFMALVAHWGEHEA